MEFEHILVEWSGEFATVTMNRPQRRNALSLGHMRELITAFSRIGESDALGIMLAGNGPVFSAGHDFAQVADADLAAVRSLLMTCTELMTLIQQVPQPVVARVHGLATAAGCQLVASADLAVASEDAGFAAPGGKGGWFCHTPMVAIARNIGRKRAAELALSGDVIDARTALDWGLVNHVVPAGQRHGGHEPASRRPRGHPGLSRQARAALAAAARLSSYGPRRTGGPLAAARQASRALISLRASGTIPRPSRRPEPGPARSGP